jgi:hypothetical protein
MVESGHCSWQAGGVNRMPVFGQANSAAGFVRGPGGHYLTGGGIECGEDSVTALARECFEECGLRVEEFSFVGSAVQLLHSAGEGWFRIEGEF